ncbi:hypothetical protein SGLAM104S_03469 [Streptomyces glaucescens]
MEEDTGGGRARELPQGQVLAGQQGGERDPGSGRDGGAGGMGGVTSVMVCVSSIPFGSSG